MVLDPALGNTIMHRSLDVLKDRVREALEEARKGGG
jgi:hypothetical protein